MLWNPNGEFLNCFFVEKQQRMCKESCIGFSVSYYYVLNITQKNKHKIFPLFFFPTLRLHRVTDVALRGIYICILFTAYFAIFSHLHGQREALKTQCREQNKTWNEYQLLENDKFQHTTILSAIFHNASRLHSHEFWTFVKTKKGKMEKKS